MRRLPERTPARQRLAWLAVVVAIVAPARVGLPDDSPASRVQQELQRHARETIERVRAREAAIEAARMRNEAFQRMAEIERQKILLEQMIAEHEVGLMRANDDFAVDDLEFTRDHLGPAQKSAVAAGYFEQLVFGSSGENAAVSHFNRLGLSLRAKVGALHLACGLSHRQTRQLELAGLGDIKRLFDRIDRRKQEYQRIRDEDADRALREMLQESMAFQPLLRSPFGNDSLFVKTLTHILTPDQWSNYELTDQLERLGGKFILRSHGSDEVRTLRMNAAAFADDRFASWKGWGDLRGLSLESTPVVDADLARLKKLEKLELLDLGGTHVTGKGLVHLENLRELKILDLRRTAVDDASLEHLGHLAHLKTLHLGCTGVTGAGLARLRALANVETLFIYQTPLTDDDLVHVVAFGKVQELGLDGTSVTDAGLAHLTGLTSLRTLALSNTKITDGAIVHLKQLKNLKTVTVFGTRVSEAAAAGLKRSLPGLKVIR